MGATFAYFSVSSGGTTNTNVTAETPDVGIVTISKGEENLYMKPSITDLAKPASADEYLYAVTNENGEVTKSTKDDANKAVTIATIQASKGEANYKCSGTLTIDLSEESNNDMASKLASGDLFVNLTTSSSLGTSFPSSAVDLSTVYGEESHKKTYELTDFTVTGTTGINIKASAYLVNKYETQQNTAGANDLSGTKLNLKIGFVLTSCEVA